MEPILQYLIGAAITAVIALLWKIDRTLAIATTTLAALGRAFVDHAASDVETFHALNVRLNVIRDERAP